jgi:hypothetical protein
MSKILQFEEPKVLTPKGFIGLFGHTEEPEFIRVGNEPNQGYYRIPKDKILKEMHVKNMIVEKASVLMTKRMRPGTSWGTVISYLEFGTGVGTGNTQNPQKEVVTQLALRTPLLRKPISSWTYLDAAGSPTAADTNVIQLTTILDENEGAGAIVEMALWGGDATASIGSGIIFNYKTFPVWNKAVGMKLTAVWKLTF